MYRLIFVLLLGGALAYFLSAPFRSSVDLHLARATTWTPEAIAASPEAYLAFCENETEKILSDLRGRELAIRAGLHVLREKREGSSSRASVGQSSLHDLKQAYRAAESAGRPLVWRGRSETLDWGKRQIVQLFREIQREVSLQETYELEIRRQKSRLETIENDRRTAQEILTEVRDQAELLRLRQYAKESGDRMMAIRSVLAGLRNDEGTSSFVGLDEIARDPKPTENGELEREFAAIMKQR